jgi:hypothetical protein
MLQASWIDSSRPGPSSRCTSMAARIIVSVVLSEPIVISAFFAHSAVSHHKQRKTEGLSPPPY